MNPLLYISSVTGAGIIFASLFLLYKKRINLKTIGPNISDEAIKAEVFGAIKISSHVPAIGLFIIGLILIIFPIYKALPPKAYKVYGTVQKADGKSARDISIYSCYPPGGSNTDGEIVGLNVSKGASGFPTLSFVAPNYSVNNIDLNKTNKITIDDGVIKIKDPVVLKPM